MDEREVVEVPYISQYGIDSSCGESLDGIVAVLMMVPVPCFMFCTFFSSPKAFASAFEGLDVHFVSMGYNVPSLSIRK